MPTLGNLQSLIQLGVAINAAIFAVSALREPSVARERTAMAALTGKFDSLFTHPKIGKIGSWTKFRSSYLETKAHYSEIAVWIERSDKEIQVVAGVFALLSFIALIYSAYCADQSVTVGWVGALIVLAIAPSLAAVAFNVFGVGERLAKLKSLRRKAETDLAEVHEELAKAGGP